MQIEVVCNHSQEIRATKTRSQVESGRNNKDNKNSFQSLQIDIITKNHKFFKWRSFRELSPDVSAS